MVSKSEVSLLDEAINRLSDPAESQCELLREHLESARTFLLGDMPEEFTFNLGLAHQAVNCISNRDVRNRIDELINRLLTEQSDAGERS
jgi:hypothetical protein